MIDRKDKKENRKDFAKCLSSDFCSCCSYQNETKEKCEQTIAGVSALLGIMGIVCLIFGVFSLEGFPASIKKLLPKGQGTMGLGLPIIALGVLVLVVSLLGCATIRYKNACFAIPFGLLNFIFGIILLIIGLFSIGMSSFQSIETMLSTTICNGDPKNPSTIFDQQYNEMIVKPMCSDICPCDQDTFAKFKASTTDEAVRKFGKTFRLKFGTETDNRWNKGISASMVILTDNTKQSKGTRFKTFKSCYDKVLSTQVADKTNNGAKLKEWFKANGVKSLALIETKFDCAGACKAPLFYITRPIDQKPTETCFKQIGLQMGAKLRVAGVVCIITSLISFIAFCGSFPLCCGFNEEEGKKYEEE